MKSNILVASPLARKMAKSKNIDLSTIKGTGIGSRITSKDIEIAIQNQLNFQVSAGTTINQSSQPLFTPQEIKKPIQNWEYENVPMSGIRKATAKAMLKSVRSNAAFTGFKKVDFTNVVNTRNDLKLIAESKQIKLTYLAFIVKAVALSLQDMPHINIQIDEANNMLQFIKNINISIAVDTPKGLLVPVIKAANFLSVFEIAHQIQDLAARARDGKLNPSEMKEGTFTISNFGSVGLDYATPIINSPESAILGIGRLNQEPVFLNNQLTSRFFMPLSITADHRIIDGADAGRFLNKVESYLMAPSLLFL